ncbi:MAG: hypothetical protein R3B72_39260 [Polyangiaceae bacterium]
MSEAEPLDRCRSILLARGYALREGTPEATAALAHLDLGAGGGYEALWVASRLIADVPLDVIAAEHLVPQEHGPPPQARQNLLIAIWHPSLGGNAEVRPRLPYAISTAGDGHGPVASTVAIATGVLLGAMILPAFAVAYPLLRLAEAFQDEPPMRVRTKDGPFDRRFEVTAASPDEVSRALPDRLRKAMVTARFAGVARIWPGLMLIFGAPPVDSDLVPTWMSSVEPLAEALHLAKGYR